MKYILPFLFSVFAVPATAQDGPQSFALPEGCTAFLTVQSKDCSVDHHFTCEGDPEGHKQRVSLTEEGVVYVGSINFETQWVGSFHPRTGHSERLAPNGVDPASFSELIETGKNTFDFETLSDEIGTDLEETKYAIRALAPDGTEVWRAEGNEYISRRWRTFFAGTGRVTTSSDSFDKDDSPVEFIFPGETGFLSANPKHGCGVLLSSFDVLE